MWYDTGGMELGRRDEWMAKQRELGVSLLQYWGCDPRMQLPVPSSGSSTQWMDMVWPSAIEQRLAELASEQT